MYTFIFVLVAIVLCDFAITKIISKVECLTADHVYYSEYIPPSNEEELTQFLSGKNDTVMLQRLTMTKDLRSFGRTYTSSFYNRMTGETPVKTTIDDDEFGE